MPALIDLRRRIKSVRNTQQITKAMKTVSTAKFKKSQRRVLESRPWWHAYPEFMSRLAGWLGSQSHPLLEGRLEKRILGVVLTSDKGLCGAFNSNLLSAAHRFFDEQARTADVRLILIGKKAAGFFKSQPFPVDLALADRADKLPLSRLKDLAGDLMRRYAHYRTDAVYVVYNEFKSILAPRVTVLRLLPVLPKDGAPAADSWSPDWEPEAAVLLRALLPMFIEHQVYHCYFESQAAEQAARMMAMDNATQNAEDLIGRLVLFLNKVRQASITKELLEIMTAVEALSK
ncbi:MAG: ATP synthase F1 subunit gamma [Candidatus Aminicenantes bacterium RBG_13_63_10]|nr:MAG: ATP synthase F1 subunit gamma [Candidatus Aminicenantes bacterium RBG_13_63_10]